MAKIPLEFDPRKSKAREVTAVFYVDGVEYVTVTQQVPEFVIPHVVGFAAVNIEDPDVDSAVEELRFQKSPLPREYRK